jgi:Tudor domain
MLFFPHSVPKMGILQNTTFRRLNPQGFNKNKVVNYNRNLIHTYRHPNPVSLENKENAMNELESEYAPNSKITLEDFVPLQETAEDDNEAAMQHSSSTADMLKRNQSPPPLPEHPCAYFSLKNPEVEVNVQNSYQFPSLPEKKEPIGGLFDDPEEYEEKQDVRSSTEQSALMKSWNKVAAALKTPTRQTIVPQNLPRVAPKLSESNQLQTPIANSAGTSLFSNPPPGYQHISAVISKPPPAFRPQIQMSELYSKPPPGYRPQITTSSPMATMNYSEVPLAGNYASSMSSASSLASLRNLDQVPNNNNQNKIPFHNISIDDPIFLVGYHGVILNPNLKLLKPHPKIFGSKVSFPVHVAIINDPGNVTFHFDDGSLRRVFNDMQRYYEELPSTALMINDINFRTGLLVAVKIFGFWHRASISGELYENGSVQVTFEDFGYSLELHRDRLRHMISTFAELPRLCFRASLVGVEALEDNDWDDESQEKLMELTLGKTLFASLRSYDASEDIYTIDLVQNFTTTKSISDELIAANVAKSAAFDTTLPYGYIYPYSEY